MNLKTENRKQSNDSPFGKGGRGGIWRKLKPVSRLTPVLRAVRFFDKLRSNGIEGSYVSPLHRLKLLVTHCTLLIAALILVLPAVVGQALAAPADQPRTGQTTVYSTGDDGALQTGVAWPNPRFTNSDGTTPGSGSVVVDQLTGLMWSKDGNAPGPAGCSPGVAKSWQGALDYVACLNTNSYLGYNDWRLPNVNELESLVHGGRTNTASWLNTQGFTNAQGYYWSSTTFASNTGYAYFVYMNVGIVHNDDKNINYSVWPVRAGQDLPRTGQTTVYSTGDDGGLQTGVAWPVPRFTNTDGTTPVSGGVVVDQLTGLMWTKDSNAPGPACSPGVAKTWQGALDYVACLNTNSYLGYNDWRLPNVNELESLVHGGQTNTATWLNTQGFTNAQADPYWSSTTYASLIDNAWVVNMYYGLVYNRYKLDNYYVWPVRSGQSGSFAYLTISKSGTGSGTVSVDKGAIIWSGSTGTASYGSAMTVNLSAVADSGTTFAGWSGACSGTGACTVTMDSDKSVTAAFTAAADTTAPTTTASPAGGAYTSAQSVTLSCSDGTGSGCNKIYYTTDGSTPTTLSTVYTTPITISSTTTLKFFAKDVAGNSEAVKTEAYTINLETIPPTTTASPAGGSYASAQSVTLTCSDGAGSGCDKIYYTMDGSTPTTSSTVYTTPIPVSSTTSLKFFAKDLAGNSEAVKTESYLISGSGAVTPRISAGGGYTVVIKSDGTLWAWGDNYVGQLGDGTNVNKNSPVQVGTETTWSQISAGGSYTAAIKSGGTLWAWGSNSSGQLGDGTNVNKNSPVQIGTDTNWSKIAAGNGHTVAIKSDGTLWAWGYNTFGQLGDGTNVNKNSPVQIGSDTNWSNISAGDSHTVALKSDGTLWAWGYNTFGQLGDGTNVSQYSPVQIGTDTNWSKIAAGWGHTVAIKSNGSLWAWGHNGSGQLGDGNFSTGQYSPVQIGTETTWSQISAGGGHTVALKSDGTLWAWGHNGKGQLGDGTTVVKPFPVQIGAGTTWNAMAAGGGHTVALKSDSTLWTWGSNGAGQVGNGTTANKNSPVQIGTETTWFQVAAGGSHTAAIKSGGTLWAWGLNNYGQLGLGTGEPPYNPAPENVMVPVQIGAGTTWSQIAIGGDRTTAIKSDGTLWYCGAFDIGLSNYTLQQIGTDSNWSQVDARYNPYQPSYYTVAIKSDGTLWEVNGYDLVQKGTDTNWSRVAAGMALKSDGTLWEVSYGYDPVQIGTDTNWSKVAAGWGHRVAIKSDGTLWAWGSNENGQVGDGTTVYKNFPVQIGTGTNWSQVAAGGDYTVAIKSDGTLWAWGDNDSGQLGIGTKDFVSHPTPVQIGLDTNWSKVAAGGGHTVAIKSNGILWAWGSNMYGQLGDGTAWKETPQYIMNVGAADTTPPTTTAAPAGGTYTSAQSVTLSCSDETESGCDKIYYTTNGSTPTTSSSVYSTPINISSTTTLKFFAEDMQGNSEGVVTHTYTIGSPLPLGSIITIAGNGTPGYSGDDVQATTSSLNYPVGVFVDSSGNVYIGDSENHRIRKVDTSGVITTVAGDGYKDGNGDGRYSGDGGQATSASLNWPMRIFVNSTGNMYIADAYNHRIRKVDTSGVITTVAGNGTAGYSGDGGPATSASINEIESIFVDGAGNIYISDTGNYRIRKVDTSGIITTVAGNGIYGYSGDGGPATSARLTETGGVFVDSMGNIYITDCDNDRVRKIDTSGIITTVAGSDHGYSGDGGPATSAKLAEPESVFVDSSGNIYIADEGNNRIRKVVTAVSDTTPPTTTASPAGGTYTSAQSVTLTCNDGTGSGCDKIYYTTNGSTPTTSSTVYSGPISISVTTTLKFFAKDLAGNNEAVKSQVYTITLDTPPSKPANIDVAQNGVKGELLISWSNPSDADFNHIHIYRSTASGTLGTLIADNVAGIKYTDTGLASLRTYYYTVRAVDNAGNESTNTNADKNEYGYYPKAKTLDATPPAVPTGVTATDATTGGKINLSWTNPTDSDFSMIKIYRSTESGTLGSAVFIGVATSYSNTGLTNGVAYYYTVRAVDTSSNETTNTTQVSATPTAPDATPPAVPTTGGTPVVDTSAGGTLTISWTNPADPDFAYVRIYRSTTSGVLGNLVFDNITGTSVTDTGLTNNATYYYTIRSVDTSGNESTNTNQISGMPTDIQVPKNVTGLTTTLLSDGKIRLGWTRSASTDVNAYNIYYDNGTGTIDYTYANKIGTVQHPTTTWTSGNLTVGPAYKFAVRAEDAAQNEETGTTTVVSAVPVTDPNAGDVKGYIKVPQIGQKISGNRVTVVTDLLTGASIDVKDMRLQYKPASSGSWTDITPADASFPNPDTTHPWFTHWDVTGLATGDYLIRAIATNVNLSTDATPAYITVTVDNSAPEASEGTNAQNEPEKRQDVSANAASKTAIATESGVTELAIPEGALSTDTKVTVTVEAPATKDSLVPSGYGKANEFRDITLDSGQTSLSNNKEAEIVIPYKDDNNDNIIDGTTTKVYDTKVMRYNETTLKWEKLDSVVDTANKVVKGKTNHFTLFGLLAPPNPTTPGWNLVSVPLNPSPNSASSVFGQTPYVYDPTTNSYTRPSTITPGIGYWINGGANLTATGTETPTTGDFSITLKKGWNMIGNPFRFKVKLSDMKVNYNAVEYTMTQAETNGIVIGTLYPYVNGNYQFVNASDGGTIEAWVGYWILSDKDCTLLVPPIPAQ